MKQTFILIALIPLYGVQAETFTLQTAQEKLLQMNPDIRIQKEEQQKAEARLSQAKSSFWPSLDLSGSYQDFSEKSKMDLTLPPPIGTIDRTIGGYDHEEYGIDLSYPLFTGGSTTQQVLAQQSSVDAQGEQLHSLQNQLSLHLAAVFYAWHIAEAAKATQDTIVAYHRDYLNRVATMVKGGVLLPSKELTAKAQLLSAQIDLQTAEDLRDSVGRSAALLLGLSPNEPFAFASDNTKADTSGTPMEIRPELAFLEKTSTGLEHQEKSLFAQRLPSVVGMVGYRIANPGLNIGSSSYMDYGLVGIQLKWNLFDGFNNQAQRAETRSQREEVQVEQEQQTAYFQEAELTSQKKIARLKQSQEAAQASWDAARMALSETQAQHDHGTASDLDLLDAQVLESKSALQLSQLVLQQRFAVWQWRYARGENLNFQGD